MARRPTLPSPGSSDERTAAAITVPAAPASVRQVRALVRATLEASDVEAHTVDTALLLVSELVTNAVLHAHTDVQVRIEVGQRLRVEVQDGATILPAPRAHDIDSIAGRGLEIVERLADGFGVDQLPGQGKCVWFTMRLPTTDTVRAPASDPGGWSPGPAPGTGTGTGTGTGVEVQLLGLPLLLYDVIREHNEALLREYALHRLGHSRAEPDAGMPAISAADSARVRLSNAVQALRGGHVQAQHLDVRLRVGPQDVAALGQLRAVFREAERLADADQVLTRPALPELRELRDWCVSELERQFGGAPPTPWRTPEPGDRIAVSASADVREAAAAVGADPRPLVLARADNRIVAVSAAASRLLGWPGEELVGRRVIVLVPPALRDAHVAGFTRHLMTGRRHVMGTTVQITAWHRDGFEIPVLLTVDRWSGVRSLYVAQLALPPGQAHR
jgi:PAS domain S-box-containing protein